MKPSIANESRNPAFPVHRLVVVFGLGFIRVHVRRVAATCSRTPDAGDDSRDQPFGTCMRWKSAQWRTTGSIDHFAADPCYVQLFREVKRRGLLAVPTLSAGQTLLSIHIGAMWLDWWVPAYDPELARYSPVRLLPETFLADSFARGHAEFDFLVGGKITSGITRHNREIGSLGKPSLALFLRYEAMTHIRRNVDFAC